MLLRGFGVISLVVGAILCLLTGAFEHYGWMWQLPLFSIGMLVLLILGAFLYLVLLCNRVDLDKEQEARVLEGRSALIKNPALQPFYREFLQETMEISKRWQVYLIQRKQDGIEC